jgi:hypothetical protein
MVVQSHKVLPYSQILGYNCQGKHSSLFWVGCQRWRKNVCSIDPDFESARNNNNPNSINEFQTLVAKKKERNLKI